MLLAIDAIGWLGAALVLLAYGLISAKKLGSQSLTYQLMNIGGALCFIVNSGYHGAIPSVATNVIWALIGLFAITRITTRKKRS